MTAIPVAGFFTDGARINSEAKTAQDDMLAILRELQGGSARTTLTISAGSVTPTSGHHAIAVESGSTDNLDNILQTNHPDGRMLIISADDGAKDIVVRNNQGGAGQITTGDGTDFTLSTTNMYMVLLRVGAAWQVIDITFGSNKAGHRTHFGTGRLDEVTVQAYTADDTYTKPADLLFAIVRLVAGGGGSGGTEITAGGEEACSAGGGGGGYCEELLAAAAIGATEVVTVGDGGLAGASGDNAGSPGGTTSFGSLLSATGGGGGSGGTATSGNGQETGGVGGVGTGGNINGKGAAGIGGNVVAGTRIPVSNGGASAMGGGGRASNNGVGGAGNNFGGGAGGSSRVQSLGAQTGATGAGGTLVVWEFKS